MNIIVYVTDTEEIEAITEAFRSIGCYESCESEYELNIPKEEMLSKMKNLGFELIQNDEFDAFLFNLYNR